MIPLSCRETVPFTDEDGIDYVFKPKTAVLERELRAIPEGEWYEKSAEFLKKILVSVTDTKKRFEGTPDYSTPEIGHILGYWHKANLLAVEEKKIS